MRVVIADDDSIVREYLGVLVSGTPGFEVVGLARNGEEAVRLVETHAPELVVMDLEMPVLGGIEAVQRIRSSHPETRIAILTGNADSQALFDGVSAGADAYLVKSSPKKELLDSLWTLAIGEARVAGAPLKEVLDEFRRLRALTTQSSELPKTISDREKDVLRGVTEGLSNKEIARKLRLEVSTVKSHLNHIFEKLQVEDRTQAALLAEKQGWFRKQPA